MESLNEVLRMIKDELVRMLWGSRRREEVRGC